MSKPATALSRSDPFHRRFRAYLAERFPILGNVLLIISYYSSNQFLAHALVHPGEPMTYSLRSLAGAVMLLCMFFHLRVFDEHKDYEEDCRHYPHRVLQSGLITLGHLRIVGGIALLIELVIAACLGLPVVVAAGGAILFSVLMLKEFFVGPWLRRHFLLYATSHMLIMPLFAMVVFSVATGRFPWEAPGWYWVYAFVGFFVTFNWEISRKIRSPDQEIEGVDSYTKVFGTYGAAYMVLLVRLVDTGMVACVGHHLGLSLWFYVVLVALFMVCMTGFLQYRRSTNAVTAKRMEMYAGMYIVAFDMTLAIELIRLHGFRIAS